MSTFFEPRKSHRFRAKYHIRHGFIILFPPNGGFGLLPFPRPFLFSKKCHKALSSEV